MTLTRAQELDAIVLALRDAESGETDQSMADRIIESLKQANTAEPHSPDAEAALEKALNHSWLLDHTIGRKDMRHARARAGTVLASLRLDGFEVIPAAPATTDPALRETQVAALASKLHRRGIGCDGHRGDDADQAAAMHLDDAYGIVDDLVRALTTPSQTEERG